MNAKTVVQLDARAMIPILQAENLRYYDELIAMMIDAIEYGDEDLAALIASNLAHHASFMATLLGY